MRQFQQHSDALAHSRESKLLPVVLIMRPLAEDSAEPGGINIRNIRDVNYGVTVANFLKTVLQSEQIIEPQWPLETQDGGCAGSTLVVGYLKLLHSRFILVRDPVRPERLTNYSSFRYPVVICNRCARRNAAIDVQSL
jgi:hypothetical protein